MQPQAPQYNVQSQIPSPSAIGKVVNNVKTGYKTTEFWMHVVYQVCLWVANYYQDTTAGHVALAGLAALSVLGYTLSRTVVKL